MKKASIRMKWTDDTAVVAYTLWGEARGEGKAGMWAVGCVVHNRAMAAREAKKHHPVGWRHPLYGDGTLRDACLMPKQFSFWNDGGPKTLPILGPTGDSSNRALALAFKLAQLLLAHAGEDTTCGATHYLTNALYEKVPVDHWAHKLHITLRLGNHIFLKEGCDRVALAQPAEDEDKWLMEN